MIRFRAYCTALAAGVVLAALGSPAVAAPGHAPGWRPGLTQVGPPYTLCTAPVGGANPYLCADFVNGVYVLNGVAYASWTAMGGTLPSGCTITGGTGEQCTGTAVATIPAANPANSYALVERGNVYNTGSAQQWLAEISDGANLIDAFQYGTHAYCGTASTSSGFGTGGGVIATAVNVSSAGAVSCSAQGHALTETGTPPNPSATLYVGNTPSGSNPTSSPYAVQSVRIYAGNFTTAQLNTAVTQ